MNPLSAAAALVAVEAAVLAGFGVGYGVGALGGDALSPAGAAVGAVLLVAAGAVLLLVARALRDRRGWSRSPAVVVQLLLGLTAFTLVATVPYAAVPGLLLTAAVLGLLATPGARRALAGD